MADPDAAAAAWYRQQVEAVQADLLRVLQKHLPGAGSQVLVHSLLETAGSFLAAIAEAEPAARPDIAQKLTSVQLHVTTIGQRPQ